MARQRRDDDFDEFRDEVADLFGARLDEDAVREVYDDLTRELGYPPTGDEVEEYADVIFDALAEEGEVEDAGEEDWVREAREDHERDQRLLRDDDDDDLGYLHDRDDGEDYYFDEGEEVELSIDTAYDEDGG